MVRSADTHAIGKVELGTTITDLYDVIRKHPMIRFGLGAPPSVVVDGLAPTTRIADHLRAPHPILLRQVERVGRLGLWPDGPCIYGVADERR